MGYDRRAAAGSARLQFEDETLGGFSVFLRPGTVDALSLLTSLGSYADVAVLTVENIRALTPLARQFATLIVDWNLEEGGVPVPVSVDYFLSLDALFVLKVTMAFARVSMGMPQLNRAPVEAPVADEDAVVASLPMTDVDPLDQAG